MSDLPMEMLPFIFVGKLFVKIHPEGIRNPLDLVIPEGGQDFQHTARKGLAPPVGRSSFFPKLHASLNHPFLKVVNL
jgi:hypothetical protein